MPGALVLYGSRYGYTRTYAQWIAEDLGGTALDLASANPEDIAEADVVVLGFSDYAGKLTDAAEDNDVPVVNVTETPGADDDYAGYVDGVITDLEDALS